MADDQTVQEDPAWASLERIGALCGCRDANVVCSIGELLLSLGVGRQYRGYGMAVEAICIAIYQEDALIKVRTCILEPIARRCGGCWKSVDRNLRTVIQRAWRMNAVNLQKLAPYPLRSEPSVAQFLSLMSTYVMRQRLRQTLRNNGERCAVG